MLLGVWLVVRSSGGVPSGRAAVDAESAAQSDLIRDLFGDPTIPFHFDRDWLAGDGIVAVAYAREIYHQGYPDSLALLADLMERRAAGIAPALEHCRGPGPHYRGCWVVDALLEHEPAVRRGLETETDWQTSVHSATYQLISSLLLNSSMRRLPRQRRLLRIQSRITTTL